MDYEKTLALVGEMAAFHPNRAKTISKYLNLWLDAKDDEEKLSYERTIRNFIAYEFHKSMNKESRVEYLNCNVNVHEFAHDAEERMPGWDITSWGANRLVVEDGEVIIAETIPREYKKGFVLPEGASSEAVTFAKINQTKLSSAADYMDRREEIITDEYQPKEGIPRRYTEHLIDYLGYRRIGDTYDKRKAANQKKIG